jgi:hypothetical protein
MSEKARLNALLLARIEELAKHLFPNGRKQGRSWRLGSLDINLKSGFWGDWDGSTTSMSKNLIDLWIYAMHVDFVTALDEIRAWLGTGGYVPELTRDIVTSSESENKLVLPLLKKPPSFELSQLSEVRAIPIQALMIAVQRGLLWTYWDSADKAKAWLITDSHRVSAVGRRLDGKPWKNGKKSKTLYRSWGAWPIGIQDAAAYPAIALVEGSPDFLALFAYALEFGVVDKICPVCMAGCAMTMLLVSQPPNAGLRN